MASECFCVCRSLWEKVQSSLTWLPTWRPSSEALLKQAEQQILDKGQYGTKVRGSKVSVGRGLTSAYLCIEVTSQYTDHYVPIDENAVIRTLVMEADSAPLSGAEEGIPLVMIHGFGAGLLQFYKNFDHLHANRRLLAFDLPGFGRSSRVRFPDDPAGAEDQFVDLIEKWREGMGVSDISIWRLGLGG